MEFQSAFQLDKTTIFEVRYCTIGGNDAPYFATTAGKLIRSKRDWSRAGQCQEAVLPKASAAYKFYRKWDKEHLRRLDDAKLEELAGDIEDLKGAYNHICHEAESFGRGGDGRDIRFSEIVALSKMEPKKAQASAA